MDGFEFLLLWVFGYVSVRFFASWYRPLSAWPKERSYLASNIFGLLPFFSLALIGYTLATLASFDVVDSGLFILFYLLFGLAWLYGSVLLLACLFDLSWVDDALNNANSAALFAITGSFLGVTLIYAGANIGDGPGWWTVLFAGGLGTIAWFVLGFAIDMLTGLFEQITVGRNLAAGVRFAFYAVASGIILARASAGDWTSAGRTIVEFCDGWPVLLLAGFAVATERFFQRGDREKPGQRRLLGSLLLGAAYLAFALLAVALLPPLNQNAAYRMAWIKLL